MFILLNNSMDWTYQMLVAFCMAWGLLKLPTVSHNGVKLHIINYRTLNNEKGRSNSIIIAKWINECRVGKKATLFSFIVSTKWKEKRRGRQQKKRKKIKDFDVNNISSVISVHFFSIISSLFAFDRFLIVHRSSPIIIHNQFHFIIHIENYIMIIITCLKVFQIDYVHYMLFLIFFLFVIHSFNSKLIILINDNWVWYKYWFQLSIYEKWSHLIVTSRIASRPRFVRIKTEKKIYNQNQSELDCIEFNCNAPQVFTNSRMLIKILHCLIDSRK